MATKTKTVDWGGLDLIVNQIKLATKPGQFGTATTLTSTELGYIDGITAGTGVVSKALVLDANGDVAMPAAGLITGLATEVVADAATLALTAAQSGSIVYVDTATAVAITLPTAAAGLRYKVIIGVTNTTGNHVISCGSGDIYQGGVAVNSTGTLPAEYFGPDTTADNTITLNSGTTGGEIGTWLEFFAVDATNWVVTGTIMSTSNTPATPFSTV